MSTLYERLGGEAAVEAAVVRFYEKVMGDAELASFFQEIDIEGQIKKQVAFMTLAFGGPKRYTGRDLRSSHSRLVAQGLTDRHFDAVAGHLLATLRELAVDAAVIDEVMTIVRGTRGDVLGG